MWDPSVIPALRLTLSPQFLVGCLRALAGQPAGEAARWSPAVCLPDHPAAQHSLVPWTFV